MKEANQMYWGKILRLSDGEEIRFSGIWEPSVDKAVGAIMREIVKESFKIIEIDKDGISYLELSGKIIHPKPKRQKKEESDIFPGFDEAYNTKRTHL